MSRKHIILFSIVTLFISFTSSQLTGNLKPNNLLANAKYIGKGIIKGPESIVFDKEGNIYTGVTNGKIIKIDKNDRTNIKDLVQIGEETDASICSMLLITMMI
jgi:hypothetical protein